MQQWQHPSAPAIDLWQVTCAFYCQCFSLAPHQHSSVANDSAALKAADIGLAVGLTDATVAAFLSTGHGSVADGLCPL